METKNEPTKATQVEAGFTRVISKRGQKIAAMREKKTNKKKKKYSI